MVHAKRRSLALTAALASALLVAALPAQAIVGGTNTPNFKHVDSGVQFTDNWVLTANHVGYAVGGTYSNGYGASTIAARYNLGPGPFPANDLALLRLGTAVAAPALQLTDTVLLPGLLALPQGVTIATGLNQSPQGYAFTELREALDSVDPDDAGPLPAVPVSWLVTYSASHGVPYVQPGDSGGGLFWGHVTDSDGAVLLGITSAQFYDPLTFEYASGFVQLASYRSWIDSTMAADLTDSQLPNWVSAVPEPSSWALLLTGGLLLAGVARRKRRASA